MKTPTPQTNADLLKVLMTFEQEKQQLIEENEKLKAELAKQSMTNKYPMVLKAKHVAEILGISEPTAYALMRRSDFPRMSMTNARVKLDAFMNWLDGKEAM